MTTGSINENPPHSQLSQKLPSFWRWGLGFTVSILLFVAIINRPTRPIRLVIHLSAQKTESQPPFIEPIEGQPVQAVPGRPVVPHEIQAMPISKPKLRLRKIEQGKGWRQHRAMIENLLTHDRRAYAIGDLLPSKAILVGIEVDHIRVMTGRSKLLSFRINEAPELAEDLALGRQVKRIRRFRPSKALIVAIHQAVEDLGVRDRKRVRTAIQALLREGESIAPTLAAHADDAHRVAIAEVQIGPRPVRSETRGDRVIAILESMTGQSFGDPTRPGARAEVARAWQDWAGL